MTAAQVDAPFAAEAGTVVAGLYDVSKTFGVTRAVDRVSVELRAGEVLALLGENGAGKSTCVKMLAGLYPPDSGTIRLGEETVDFATPTDAHDAGIATVHQSPATFPTLSITENIYAGQQERTSSRLLDLTSMNRKAAEWLALLGVKVDPTALVGTLRTGEQQLIEIARSLAANARVLILDEPTAALSRHEVTRLFEVVDRLKARGVAIMFVGHRLEEVFAIADRVTVLRDGRFVATEPASSLTPSSVVKLMVGRELTDLYPRSETTFGQKVLEVDDLTREGEYESVHFTVRAGEIVGLGGLVGAGRTEIARTLFGITKAHSGRIMLDGKEIRPRTSKEALKHGIAYVSEDRRGQSLIMDFSILDNATLPILGRTTRFGLTSKSKELAAVSGSLDQMRLRFSDYGQAVGTLSGGNQQKVVLAKWLATNPRVLILDEPTQGIDVQAKAEVHRLVRQLAAEGIAIVLISSDMPELIAMSDSVVVLREGQQTAVLDRRDVTQEAIGAAATGAVDEPLAAPSSVTHSQDEPAIAQPPERVTTGSNPLRRLAADRDVGLIAVILAIAIPVTIINPRFADASNLTALAVDLALLTMVAAGQMVVMLTGNIDVSVASIVGLSAYVSAMLVRDIHGLPIGVAVLAGLLVGVLGGLCNGAIVAYGKVPAIVATLGTLAIFRGITSVIADGRQISASDVPDNWLALASARVGPIPMLLIVAVALLVALAAYLRRTSSGREYYQVGSSMESATLIGIDARRRILRAYLTSGAICGFVGAMWASNYATVDSRVATGFELTVIAAVIVGGVAITGGVGTVRGIALGALLLLLIRNGLSLVKVNPLWLQAAYGLVIILAVVLNLVVSRRAKAAGAV